MAVSTESKMERWFRFLASMVKDLVVAKDEPGYPGIRVDEGRWANPFGVVSPGSPRPDVLIRVPDDATAVRAFMAWLGGWSPAKVSPRTSARLRWRKRWIFEHLHRLDDRRLVCAGAPAMCHGHILAWLAMGLDEGLNSDEVEADVKQSVFHHVTTLV